MRPLLIDVVSLAPPATAMRPPIIEAPTPVAQKRTLQFSASPSEMVGSGHWVLTRSAAGLRHERTLVAPSVQGAAHRIDSLLAASMTVMERFALAETMPKLPAGASSSRSAEHSSHGENPIPIVDLSSKSCVIRQKSSPDLGFRTIHAARSLETSISSTWPGVSQ